jgi:hypothetical protein
MWCNGVRHPCTPGAQKNKLLKSNLNYFYTSWDMCAQILLFGSKNYFFGWKNTLGQRPQKLLLISKKLLFRSKNYWLAINNYIKHSGPARPWNLMKLLWGAPNWPDHWLSKNNFFGQTIILQSNFFWNLNCAPKVQRVCTPERALGVTRGGGNGAEQITFCLKKLVLGLKHYLK